LNIDGLTIAAAAPLIWLLVGLGWLRLPARWVGFSGLGLVAVIAYGWFDMNWVRLVEATIDGIVLALWPILWAIFGAIYAYNIGVRTGAIATMKNTLATLSGDRRVQVLILAWAFSGFLEGATGYGTAVAIPVSILVALGFPPVPAAVVCLVGNTAPTAFGAIGVPVITLANVTGLQLSEISRAVAMQLSPVIMLLPWVLVVLSSEKGMKIRQVIGVTLISGFVFTVVHYWAAVLGPELPALLGGVASLIAIVIWLRLTQSQFSSLKVNPERPNFNLRDNFIAWSPYLILLVMVLATSNLFPKVNSWLEQVQTSIQIYHGPNGQPAVIHWLLTPGTLIFVAALIGGTIQGAGYREFQQILVETARQVTPTVIVVCSIVALAKIMNYSGMVSRIAETLAQLTGLCYPLIAPAVGAVGTFMTGSDTSANVLFGQLQKETAIRLGLNPYWIAAANTAGATAGKMLSPQNIAIAAAAAGLNGREGDLFRGTLKICLGYIVGLGLLVYFWAR
jgi:lactate permease